MYSRRVASSRKSWLCLFAGHILTGIIFTLFSVSLENKTAYRYECWQLFVCQYFKAAALEGLREGLNSGLK